MPLRKLRADVFRANSMLVENGLVVLAWGNASGIDRAKGLVAIKPSGVAYSEMRPDNLVVVDLEGRIIEGSLRPSSDLPTHLALYNAWPEIGGVVHTHSTYGTVFSQACRPVPCYGTTHADFCPGDVPCVRALTQVEVEEAYEAKTGAAIVEHYKTHNLNPMEYPGTVVSHHGPFTWGKNAAAAADNALILENVAKMALLTRQANSAVGPMPHYIIDKHYSRKHGPNAYYGQK